MRKWTDELGEMSTGVAILVVILVIILALCIVFGVMCFEAWLLMLLWNAVVPALWATAPTLSFWLAMGLMLICNILFKTVHHCCKKD